MGRRRIPEVDASGPKDSLHAKVVVGELDLHGCTGHEAEVKLEAFLSRWRGQEGGAVVRVITGRGNRSAGAPVLRKLVSKLLAGQLSSLVAEFVSDSGGGAYRVRVR